MNKDNKWTEEVYYSLFDEHPKILEDVKFKANNLGKSSFLLENGENERWLMFFEIRENNQAFLEEIRKMPDVISLEGFLSNQLKEYYEKYERNYESIANYELVYNSKKKWLEHTTFICSREYNNTNDIIYKEVINWCEKWQSDYLEQYNPFKNGWIMLPHVKEYSDGHKISFELEFGLNLFHEKNQGDSELERDKFLSPQEIGALDYDNLPHPKLKIILNPNMIKQFYESNREMTPLRKGLLSKNSETSQKKNHNPPSTFEEMFVNKALVQDCIDVLKKIDPPLLNVNEIVIGDPINTFAVWVEIMKYKNLINSYSDKIYATHIKEKFGLDSLDDSIFRKPTPRADEKYRTNINILLSQVSQKGNL